MNLTGTSCRSPAEHRAAIAAWRESAPANDSDIIPRHRAGAGKPDFEPLFPALKTWRDLCEPAAPLSTNWLSAAANDDEPDAEDDKRPDPPQIESRHEIRPREREMTKAIRSGDTEHHENGALARLGSLRFASGETAERALVLGEDGKLRKADIPVPRGALVAWQARDGRRGRPVVDRFAAPKGAGEDQEDTAARNAWLAETLGAQPARYVERTRSPRRLPPGLPNPQLPPTNLPLNEARAFCGLPPVAANDNRPGLPCASEQPLDSFLGLRCTSTGIAHHSSGGPALERLEAAGTAALLRKRLGADDVRVLDAAMEAQNFREIGEMFGYHDRHAEKAGKQRLLSAAAHLKELLQKDAA
ncbi:hypothetical protein Snov_1959 [Ancylobacter novellus DSM 506]|uniref:Uncharacterized protein n=1 Tax=Ancylobacter novellus (strain ATCC 8093 / DSM 506 / JCM 20403 / CCM 1077 / IAM 12100 / NBRC 12443 / NCIMB 10456) TaxID=639283 RepID=D6ZZC3_ANCN5|nr:hypothetical protein [Ancylobacter novellus]ADH89259.1 hypothetical protein Snov_1959 [Ancylobacter novellus DSM 506]